MREAGHFLVFAAQQGFQLHLVLLLAPFLQGNASVMTDQDTIATIASNRKQTDAVQ